MSRSSRTARRRRGRYGGGGGSVVAAVATALKEAGAGIETDEERRDERRDRLDGAAATLEREVSRYR